MSSLHTGDRLDHYLIEGVAARSGMASIFRASDLRTGRQVAIKVPHAEIDSDPVFFERFHREEEIGKRLDHPGVVKVLTECGSSQPYIVMDWVEGILLRHVLNQHSKLAAERATRIALRICGVLHYIHTQGVVHRDLKPENVIVDAGDHVKLIDFGIAANARARRITFARLSQTMGTPDYISPEQLKGGSGDARSDVYALGVMLYEMLTGTVPFTGPNLFVIMNARLVDNPVPPREINPEISPQLQEVIYRALERNPSRRYASAREFAWDLDHQDQVAAASRPELRDWKRRRAPRTRKILLCIGFATISVVMFGLLLHSARSYRVSGQPPAGTGEARNQTARHPEHSSPFRASPRTLR